MSTHNGVQFLANAIDSLLAQTLQSWQLLVVDDASSDGTAELVRSYGDARINIVELSNNIGQTAALNHGLELIETPWVARLDQDDIALPERLARQLSYVESSPDTVLVGAWVDFIDEHGCKYDTFSPPCLATDVRSALFTRSCPIVHSAAFFNVKLARDLGGYKTDLDYAEDLDLWIKLSQLGGIANVDRVLVQLRKHRGQTTHSSEVASQLLTETLDIISELPRDLQETKGVAAGWQGYRWSLMLQSVFYAAHSRCWPAVAAYAGRAFSHCVRHPSVLLWLMRKMLKRGG